MRRYDEIRERHRHEQSDRIEEISRVIPEIKQLNDEAADASLAAARARITNKSANLDQYHAEMSRITERRASLLRTHGYPADYLDMHYDCPVCHDTGLVDGKHCACFRKIAAEIVYGKYSLGKILETENFEHFSFAYYSDTIRDDSTGRTARELAERAYQAAKALVPAIGTDGSSLYIFGTAGTGKTFLTHCSRRFLQCAGRFGLPARRKFRRASHFRLRSARHRRSGNRSEQFICLIEPVPRRQ